MNEKSEYFGVDSNGRLIIVDTIHNLNFIVVGWVLKNELLFPLGYDAELQPVGRN